MKTRVTLRYFASYCLWKLVFDSNSAQTTANLICLTFLGTQSLFALFRLKIREISGEKSTKTCFIL